MNNFVQQKVIEENIKREYEERLVRKAMFGWFTALPKLREERSYRLNALLRALMKPPLRRFLRELQQCPSYEQRCFDKIKAFLQSPHDMNKKTMKVIR
jgi:tRNA(Ile)-lysidine synthase TilS/MesJ